MVLGFAILFGFQLAGEALVRAFGWPLPGHVAGMALLVVALAVRVVRVEWVRPAARALLDHLGLLFVPAGVGVMAHFALLANDWPALGAAIIGSTLITVAVTALVMVWLSRLTGGRDAGDGEPVDREGQV